MVAVKLFGLVKSLAENRSELTLSLDEGRCVKDLIGRLAARYPQIGELVHKKKVLVSVNQEIAHEDTEIKDGDEVALLPPFAGGAAMMPGGGSAGEDLLVRVQRENFSLDEELDRVRRRSTRIGGVAMFLGTARDR